MQFLIDVATKIHDSLFAGEWFSGLYDTVVGTLNGLLPIPLIPVILALLGVIVMLAGKKILPLLKFVLMFTVGFIAAYVYVAPILSFLAIDAWIVGVVVGALCGLLSRYLYLLAVIGGCSFVGFFLTNQFILDMDVVGEILASIPGGAGKYVSYVVLAGICMLFVFPLLKWVEMGATSLIGSSGIYFSVVSVFPALKLADIMELPTWNFDVLAQLYLPSFYAAADFIAIGVFFLFGLITQIVTRKRY